jgi:hypothetical protein
MLPKSAIRARNDSLRNLATDALDMFGWVVASETRESVLGLARENPGLIDFFEQNAGTGMLTATDD